MHGTALLERNKSNVVAYYTRAFNDKEPEDAVDKYVGFDKPGEDLDESGEEHLYIQHNPLAESGAPAFIAFVRSFTAAFPNYHVDIRRVVAECDLVDARSGHGRRSDLADRREGRRHLPARQGREDRRALGRPRGRFLPLPQTAIRI